ncbi:acetyltransferase GNAT domain containing protein [Nitzschia inconspicua]|uniref:Acetyltransferase GNAT domain containing protein n=1 Tax=Nitzschia inconspicua TaxID=303405 RepID=A0A9K3KWK8_9STRA|nr:acetyltransferase GNAT domain containing protein [Nitzschia inconspicua]
MIRLFLAVILFFGREAFCFTPQTRGVLSLQGSAYENYSRDDGKLQMFFADESSTTESKEKGDTANVSGDVIGIGTPAVELVVADSERFLNAVGSFLVDSFWLSSDHHQLGNDTDITNEARMQLVIEQCADLQEKYGERMGKRLSKTSVVGALDKETKELIGVVTLKETILINSDVLDPEKAELIAQNAVASLGPKQRREYKNAPLRTIATELLSSDTKAVCVLSNLAVSRKARRRGVGSVLCEEIEALAQDWGYDAVHLLVEKENFSARQLYENKLGYKKLCMNEAVPALRVDPETGSFQEIQADTLVLFKRL